MKLITDIAGLEAAYPRAVDPNSLNKVATGLIPEYTAWIEAAKFCILSTVGAEGTDASPRGDDGPVVRIVDGKTLWLPDWRGNNRLDSLRNIVTDGRVSLMFMVPDQTNVVRINGAAVLTVDPEVTGQFEQGGRNPASVIVITIAEVYSQCARAILRADLWGENEAPELPTMGQILKALTHGAVDGSTYDANWAERAKKTMW